MTSARYVRDTFLTRASQFWLVISSGSDHLLHSANYANYTVQGNGEAAPTRLLLARSAHRLGRKGRRWKGGPTAKWPYRHRRQTSDRMTQREDILPSRASRLATLGPYLPTYRMLHIYKQETWTMSIIFERMDCHMQRPVPSSHPRQMPADKGIAIPNQSLQRRASLVRRSNMPRTLGAFISCLGYCSSLLLMFKGCG